MKTQQENKQSTSKDNLLTAQEQAVCMQISKREAPHSQRALALLVLNEGETQGQAADKSGLSTGQVKYWVSRFRNHRLGIFPDPLLDEIDAKAGAKTAKGIEMDSKASAKGKDSVKSESKNSKDKKDKKSKKKGKKSRQKAEKSKKAEKKNKTDKKGKKKKGKKNKNK
jgi:hypothetical protein